MRTALYARVSRNDQDTTNQLIDLRAYAKNRDWTFGEYVDEGVSGARESRPELNRLLRDVKARRVDRVVCWSLDRVGRNLKHLVTLLDDLHALGVSFVSLKEGIDWSTPSGRLQAQLLACIAEFERARLRERVVAGLARARMEGRRIGRPPRRISRWELAQTEHLGVRAAAQELKTSPSVVQRARQKALRAKIAI